MAKLISILGNQSLRHRIDKCALNYNSLNDTSKPEESTFNKKKRKLEEAQTSTPKQAKVDKRSTKETRNQNSRNCRRGANGKNTSKSSKRRN